MQREPIGSRRRLRFKTRLQDHSPARHFGEGQHRCATSYGPMQTRCEPCAASGKLKLCLQKKALLQAYERGKCPCCVPDRGENILLSEPGIYPLAPSKKYFRDPAKHMAGSPVSGIFVTDSPGLTARPPSFRAFEDRPGERPDAYPREAPDKSADAPPVTIRTVFRPRDAGKGWNERGLPMLVRRTSGFTESPFFEGSWNFLTVTPHP